MRSFKYFPKNSICKLCGTNNNLECTLISIDNTNRDSICGAIPVHTACLNSASIRYDAECNHIYLEPMKTDKR